MQAIIVVDLGFGDAGKGSLVDYYVRRHHAHTVIRFNGGAQAAHNVITPDGRHHTFSQFGSGTFVPGVRTHLSRFMLMDPLALLAEEKHLQQVGIHDAFARLTIDPAAPIVTPFQRAANRLRELQRGAARHGSCGMGIGETMADMVEDESQILRAGDLLNKPLALKKLQQLQQLKLHQLSANPTPDSPAADQEWSILRDPFAPAEFANLFTHVAQRIQTIPTAEAALHTSGTVLFEAAQGVLLDEWHGFHPYTTWSTTTFANALTLLRECNYPGRIRRVGATRAYMTRHGPGPFVTEDRALARLIPDHHNGLNPWQREFRIGWLDFFLLRYALNVAGGADELAVTCLDRLAEIPNWKICRHYNKPISELIPLPPPNLDYQQSLTNILTACTPNFEPAPCGQEFLDMLANDLHCPVRLTSHGPTWQDKIPHRPQSARRPVPKSPHLITRE